MTPETVEHAQQVLDDINKLSAEPQQIAPRTQVLPREDSRPAASPQAGPLVMSHPEDMGEFFGALAAAQAAFGPIERTLTAKVTSRREGAAGYSYDYAPLDAVLEVARPVLAGQGFALIQAPQVLQNGVLVRTMVAHKSGRWIQNDLKLACQVGVAQEVGGAITYAKRYALLALLGIAPESDDDGAKASGRDQETFRRQASQQSQPSGSSDEETTELITACRPVKHGDTTLYGIKTTTGECWTDDKNLYEQAKAAMQNRVGVVITREIRQVGKNQLRWVTEMAPRRG